MVGSGIELGKAILRSKWYEDSVDTQIMKITSMISDIIVRFRTPKHPLTKRLLAAPPQPQVRHLEVYVVRIIRV